MCLPREKISEWIACGLRGCEQTFRTPPGHARLGVFAAGQGLPARLTEAAHRDRVSARREPPADFLAACIGQPSVPESAIPEQNGPRARGRRAPTADERTALQRRQRQRCDDPLSENSLGSFWMHESKFGMQGRLPVANLGRVGMTNRPKRMPVGPALLRRLLNIFINAIYLC